MELSLIALGINGGLVLLFIILSAVLAASGVIYTKNIGDLTVQTPLKWRMLRIMVFMIFVGLAMAIFNILLVEGFITLS